MEPFSAFTSNAPSIWTFSKLTSPSTIKTDFAVKERLSILLSTRSNEHPKDGDKTTLLPIGNDMPLNFCFESISGSGTFAPANRKILLAQL